MDVRPHFVQGTERIAVDLELDRRDLAVREIEGFTPRAGPLQAPMASGFGRQTNVMCKAGHWTLAGLETRGTGDDAEDVALFVRARANILK